MIIDVDYSRLVRKRISGIYKITNLKNSKCYIGQSTHLRHRISDYIHIHERDGMTHPIARAIKKDGTDNFKFEVICYCDPDKLSDMELFYINKFNTTDPEFGYNQIRHTAGANKETQVKMSESHIGLKETSNTKRKKSNSIFVFDSSHQKLLISDSAKLFGDFIYKSKDEVKNALRNPSSILTYYVYYGIFSKREEIYQKILNKRCIRNLQFISDISLINNLMKKGVETIYREFDVYRLSYDVLDTNERPIPIKVSNGNEHKNNPEITFMVDKDQVASIKNLCLS